MNRLKRINVFRYAFFLIVIGFFIGGCKDRGRTYVTSISPTFEKHPSETPLFTPELMPSSTSTPSPTITSTILPSSTPTPSPTPILFAETQVLSIDSLTQDQSANYPPLVLLWERKFPPKWKSSLIFTPDSSKFFYSYGLAIRVVDMKLPDLITELAFNKKSMVYHFSVAPDGKRISTSDSNSILVIDLEEKVVQKKINAFLFSTWITQFSPDGHLLLAADFYDNVVILDTDTWEEISRLSFPSSFAGLWWMPDGERIVLDDGLGTAHFYDLIGQELGSVKIGAHGKYYFVDEHGENAGYVELEPDGTLIIRDGDGQKLGSVKFKLEITGEIKIGEAVKHIIKIMFFHPTGLDLGVARRDGTGTFRFRNQEGEEVAVARLERGIVTITKPTGEWIGAFRVERYAAGYRGYPVQILNPEDAVTEEFVAEHRWLLSPLPNGTSLAVIGVDGIRSLDIATETSTCFIPFIETHDRYFLAAEIVAVLTLDQDNRLKVVDLETGNETYISQELNISLAKAMAISPNKAIIAMIIEKPNDNNRYLQLWGLVVED